MSGRSDRIENECMNAVARREKYDGKEECVESA